MVRRIPAYRGPHGSGKGGVRTMPRPPRSKIQARTTVAEDPAPPPLRDQALETPQASFPDG
jgi:hypothetical protein